MIFDGSHDTKDWSNEDENNIVILFHNIYVFTVYIKNAALEGIETSLKTIQICIVLNICTVRLKKNDNNYKLHNVYYKKNYNKYILIIIIILLRNLCIFTSSIYGCQFAIKVPQGVRSSDTVVFSVVFAILQRSYPRFNLN